MQAATFKSEDSRATGILFYCPKINIVKNGNEFDWGIL